MLVLERALKGFKPHTSHKCVYIYIYICSPRPMIYLFLLFVSSTFSCLQLFYFSYCPALLPFPACQLLFCTRLPPLWNRFLQYSDEMLSRLLILLQYSDKLLSFNQNEEGPKGTPVGKGVLLCFLMSL